MPDRAVAPASARPSTTPTPLASPALGAATLPVPHPLRWLVMVAGPVVLVLLLGALALGSAARAHAAVQEAERARQAVRTLDALLLRLVDAESGARGWVATGDARFLEPTRRARAEVAWSVDALRRLAAADAAQVERVQVLAARAEAALDHVDGLVARQVTGAPAVGRAGGGGRGAELRAWALAQGKTRLDAAREAAAALSVAEDRRLMELATAARRWERTVQGLALLAVVAAVALAVGLHRTFRRHAL